MLPRLCETRNKDVRHVSYAMLSMGGATSFKIIP